MELSGPSLFDRRFVIVASSIGALYPTVVLVSGSLGGKEDAGWAGLALAVVATALYTRFETRHFRRVAMVEQLPEDVFRLSLPRVVLLAFCFSGGRVLVGGVVGLILPLLQLKPPEGDPVELVTWYLANWQILTPVVCGNVICYMAVGYLIKKVFSVTLDSEIVIAAIASLVLGVAVSSAPLVLSAPDVYFEELQSNFLAPAAFWLLHLSCALIGGRLAEPGSLRLVAGVVFRNEDVDAPRVA